MSLWNTRKLLYTIARVHSVPMLASAPWVDRNDHGSSNRHYCNKTRKLIEDIRIAAAPTIVTQVLDNNRPTVQRTMGNNGTYLNVLLPARLRLTCKHETTIITRATSPSIYTKANCITDSPPTTAPKKISSAPVAERTRSSATAHVEMTPLSPLQTMSNAPLASQRRGGGSWKCISDGATAPPTVDESGPLSRWRRWWWWVDGGQYRINDDPVTLEFCWTEFLRLSRRRQIPLICFFCSWLPAASAFSPIDHCKIINSTKLHRR